MISKAEAQATVAAMFESAAAITQEQLITLGGGGGGEAPIVFDVPGALLTAIPANRVDGTTVLPNDEQMRLQAAVLPPGWVIKPGDYFIGIADGMQRNVITAHLDAMGVLWTCAVRRVF